MNTPNTVSPSPVSPADATPHRLAVVGSPISHSKSPALHNAAYRALGLNWQYEAVELASGELASFIAGLGTEWRGLSLTMPFKHEVLPLIADLSELAVLTGAVNTVLLGTRSSGPTGFNTDVPGLVHALAEGGITAASNVVVLGAGATAASALAAAAELGAESVEVLVRNRQKAAPLVEVARRVGLTITVTEFAEAASADCYYAPIHPTELVISTLPGGTELTTGFTREFRHSAALFDVAYSPWPSALAQAWVAAGGTALSGEAMLLHQALIQVRIFVSGDAFEALPDESAVLAAMRAVLTS